MIYNYYGSAQNKIFFQKATYRFGQASSLDSARSFLKSIQNTAENRCGNKCKLLLKYDHRVPIENLPE